MSVGLMWLRIGAGDMVLNLCVPQKTEFLDCLSGCSSSRRIVIRGVSYVRGRILRAFILGPYWNSFSGTTSDMALNVFSSHQQCCNWP